MSAEEEYITEWPPLTGGGNQSLICEHLPPRRKRRKFQSEDRFVLSLISSPPSKNIDVLLTRWWKHKRSELESAKASQGLIAIGEASRNPSTIMFHVSRLPEAQEFIKNRVSHLLSLPESFFTCYSLATCFQRLGGSLETTESALKYSHQAKALKEGKDEGNGKIDNGEEDTLSELEWLMKVLERQKWVEEEEKRRLHQMEGRMPPAVSPEYIQVERQSCMDLGCEEFYERYLLTQTPVIITDLVCTMTSSPWTLQHVKEVVGDKVAPLKKLVPGSIEWAKLEDAGESPVSSFIDSLQIEEDKRYLFDWSLPLNCPKLMEELTLPEYVSDNLLRQTPPGSLYRDSWPSLFIAPPNIVSELHVDAFASNFWMALFEGKKRWVFFPPEDTPLLYPIYHHSTDAMFQVDLSDWSEAIRSHPLLAFTHPRECILEAGEFLFVPSGSAHRVENLETSVAISANFVNASNYSKVLRELQVNGLVDPRAKELCKTLKLMGCPQKPT